MSFMDHLPILVVIIPLLTAPLCVLLNRPILAWFVSILSALISFFIAIQLVFQVNELGTISYWLGGWEPPWGIEYRIDLLAAYVFLL